MGNHGNRAALRRFLLGEVPSMAPFDLARVIDGLGIINVDTSVPGFHHGDRQVPIGIRLDPLAAPRHTAAIAELCQALNTTDTVCLGTTLTLRYSVKSHRGPHTNY
jgi:hypothetical protein